MMVRVKGVKMIQVTAILSQKKKAEMQVVYDVYIVMMMVKMMVIITMFLKLGFI